MSLLSGELKLVCGPDPHQRARTRIHEQFVSAPFHISKPYWDGEVLIVQVVNPTAGLFAGDRLCSEVKVESGGRVLITTPSASRVHTSSGGRAEVCQAFDVAADGWLEYSPAMLIPQKGGRYRQRTHVRVEEGGELFFLETLSPGRVARGEWFQFEEVDWDFNLEYAGRLIARERFRLRPEDDSLVSLRQAFSSAYYASGYLITERIAERSPAWDRIRALHSDVVRLGVSRLMAGGWSLRLLAADSVSLSRAIRQVRGILGEERGLLRREPRAHHS